jgi:hypothetical protein
LPELDVEENEENRPLQEVEQEKLKAAADDTFQMETVVEINHQKH